MQTKVLTAGPFLAGGDDAWMAQVLITGVTSDEEATDLSEKLGKFPQILKELSDQEQFVMSFAKQRAAAVVLLAAVFGCTEQEAGEILQTPTALPVIRASIGAALAEDDAFGGLRDGFGGLMERYLQQLADHTRDTQTRPEEVGSAG